MSHSTASAPAPGFAIMSPPKTIESAPERIIAEVVDTVIHLQTSFAAGAFDIVTGDVERLGGRPPKPLRDVLAQALQSPSA